MIEVIEVLQTCDFCPAQWEGKTDDGRFIYARYRWERLTIRIGASPQEAIGGELVYEALLEDDLDGPGGYAKLKAATAEVISWPDVPSQGEDP